MNDIELKHYGIPGMKWGVRKLKAYTNKDKNHNKSRDKPEKTKEEILKTGSASEVLKIRSKLSNQEMRDAVKRFELEQKLKDYSSKEIRTSMQKMDKAMKSLKMTNNWLGTGIGLYNNIAAIYNATENGRKKPLTRINKGDSGKKGK